MLGRFFARTLRFLILLLAMWGAGQFFSVGRFYGGPLILVGLALAALWFWFVYRLIDRIEIPVDERKALKKLEAMGLFERERFFLLRGSFWRGLLPSALSRKRIESTDELHLNFWAEWLEHLKRTGSPLQAKKLGALRWLDIDVGRTGFKLAATISPDDTRLGMQLKMFGPQFKEHFQELRAQRAPVEAQLGFALEWVPEWHVCRITVYRPDSPLTNVKQWGTYRKWLTQVGVQMDEAFRPLIRELK